MSQPLPAQDDSERRIAPRTRTLKRAKILFNNRFSTFDCIVRNLSATGALLTIDPAAPLPKVFEVRIGDDDMLRPAKLVYRRELFAGIHFLDGPEDEEAEVSIAASQSEFEAMAPEEPLRIQARPLPLSIAQRLPWSKA